jgi:hypothetical protein
MACSRAIAVEFKRLILMFPACYLVYSMRKSPVTLIEDFRLKHSEAYIGGKLANQKDIRLKKVINNFTITVTKYF